MSEAMQSAALVASVGALAGAAVSYATQVKHGRPAFVWLRGRHRSFATVLSDSAPACMCLCVLCQDYWSPPEAREHGGDGKRRRRSATPTLRTTAVFLTLMMSKIIIWAAMITIRCRAWRRNCRRRCLGKHGGLTRALRARL